MTMWHGDRGRKATGGLVVVPRGKKKHEMGSLPMMTRLGKEKRVIAETKGGGAKTKAAAVEFANVFDRKTKKASKVKILAVLENAANLHYVRRNVITKGAVVNTEIGRARIVSRPSQDGVVNAILLEEAAK